MLLPLLAALAGAPPGPVVILRAPSPPARTRRLTNQLVDTPWRLVLGPERGPGDPLDADLDLATDQEARAVLEFTQDAGGLRVRIVDARRGRAYVREVASLDDGPSGPVTEEAAAVLVRDSLLALLHTGALSWQVEAERPRWRAELGVVGRTTLDGLSLAPGLGLRFGLGRGEWSGVLEAQLGLPATRTLDPARVRLRRHLLRLGFTRRWPLTRALALEAGPSAGVAVYRRVTETVSGGAETEPRTTVVALLGAEARLVLRLGPTRLWLGTGADAALGAPALVVRRDEVEETLERSWPVAPWAALGFSMAFHDPIEAPAPSVAAGTGRAGP